MAEIAEERGLTMQTVEHHLAQCVARGEISVDELVSEETKNMIISHLVGDDDLRMGPVKEALGDKVTWGEIRLVVSHIKYMRKK